MRMIRNLMLTLAVGLSLAACGGKSDSTTADEMPMGNEKAALTMVEYASVACPHCARFNNDVFPAFKAKYIDTGKVHYIAREQLTGDERMAAAGFLVARCAGKDKYFQVTDAIYRDQANIYNDMRNGLLNIAKSAGMTEDQFTKCISDSKAIDALNERVARFAKKDNISGTPTFILNGKEIASGEVTMEQLDKAIADAGGAK
jgi:protein-disulfide isomerase